MFNLKRINNSNYIILYKFIIKSINKHYFDELNRKNILKLKFVQESVIIVIYLIIKYIALVVLINLLLSYRLFKFMYIICINSSFFIIIA